MGIEYQVRSYGIVTSRPTWPLRRGIEWRPLDDDTGVWRTAGRPATIRKILGFDRRAMRRVAKIYGVGGFDVRPLAAMAAVETGGRRKRWRREPDGRTSYGVFQFLGVTAKAVAGGVAVTPAQLYSVEFSTMLAIKDILQDARKRDADPIELAAIWNAGRLRRSARNAWGWHVHGDHLDRMAAYYGDACAALRGG